MHNTSCYNKTFVELKAQPTYLHICWVKSKHIKQDLTCGVNNSGGHAYALPAVCICFSLPDAYVGCWASMPNLHAVKSYLTLTLSYSLGEGISKTVTNLSDLSTYLT